MKRLFLIAMSVVSLVLMEPAAATNVRSQKVKDAFAKLHPCPSTGLRKASCPGFIIDDIEALDCGGKDVVSNKQWQTLAASREKDKWERNGPNCKHRTHGKVPPQVRT
jgi:hypothetical protein